MMTAVAAPLAVIVLLAAGFSADDDASASSGINLAALPGLAQQLLPQIGARLQTTCPELPVLWLLAQVQAESGWDPTAFSPAGAAGLLQMTPGTWQDAGGTGPSWTAEARPLSDHPVWDPAAHLDVAVPSMCANLRAVTAHLRDTGKPAEALDALAVCHIAGCSRVFESASGIPVAGEAGCGVGCAAQVTDYLATIHRWVAAFAAPAAAPVPGAAGAPAPYPGGATGCAVADPTGTGGCVTAATAWLLAQVAAVHTGPVSCWDAHAWNPSSDHPRGRACDYTIGRLGAFPGPADTARGWALAQWLRAHAAGLRVSYVIWQGRIWSTSRNREGWRPYGGGGVYNPGDATGGHYDHIHVSLTDK